MSLGFQPTSNTSNKLGVVLSICIFDKPACPQRCGSEKYSNMVDSRKYVSEDCSLFSNCYTLANNGLRNITAKGKPEVECLIP